MYEQATYATARSADAIDRAAGLRQADAIFGLREKRPEFLNGAEACRTSVLTPADDLGLDAGLRSAIGRRVARTAANGRLFAEYPAPADPDLVPLAEGATPSDEKLATLARHVDMIAADPASASEGYLQRLLDAGFTIPQVIALSELLGFLCFQIRVAHGLSLLNDAS